MDWICLIFLYFIFQFPCNFRMWAMMAFHTFQSLVPLVPFVTLPNFLSFRPSFVRQMAVCLLLSLFSLISPAAEKFYKPAFMIIFPWSFSSFLLIQICDVSVLFILCKTYLLLKISVHAFLSILFLFLAIFSRIHMNPRGLIWHNSSALFPFFLTTLVSYYLV